MFIYTLTMKKCMDIRKYYIYTLSMKNYSSLAHEIRLYSALDHGKYFIHLLAIKIISFINWPLKHVIFKHWPWKIIFIPWPGKNSALVHVNIYYSHLLSVKIFYVHHKLNLVLRGQHFTILFNLIDKKLRCLSLFPKTPSYLL